MIRPAPLACACLSTLLLLSACADRPPATSESATVQSAAGPGGTTPGSGQGPRAAVVRDACSGAFPSYWQDPDPRFADMWKGQAISNQPPKDWSGPVFRLSDRFPTSAAVDSGAQGWGDKKYDVLFAADTAQDRKTTLARDYIWDVMRYIQEGNIDSGDEKSDWNLCENRVRNWYHMPFQTYDTLSGREFVHGLTREAPVTFSLKAVSNPDKSDNLATTVWAVAFFNPTAAHTLGKVWKADGTAVAPTTDLSFDDGAVIGKLLFSTASPKQMPILEHMPAWTANISDPAFCNCKPNPGERSCSQEDESQQCPRSTTRWTPLHLLQFDVSVKDHRAQGTGWVFGTFVADGQHAAAEKNSWNRIAPLGLMWGNDPPPAGGHAINTPADPRAKGFAQEVIFWDVVARLNAGGGTVAAKQPGHLGCNSRLNGPADNANSACMSCHMTASVADGKLMTPPIIAQFGSITPECVAPSASDPATGKDASGAVAKVIDDVSFAQMDALYFANTSAGAPFNATVSTATGPHNVLVGEPQYENRQPAWISLDYSLQLSISLVQWGQWRQHQAEAEEKGVRKKRFNATLPAR
jgi:hypothetical protein